MMLTRDIIVVNAMTASEDESFISNHRRHGDPLTRVWRQHRRLPISRTNSLTQPYGGTLISGYDPIVKCCGLCRCYERGSIGTRADPISLRDHATTRPRAQALSDTSRSSLIDAVWERDFGLVRLLAAGRQKLTGQFHQRRLRQCLGCLRKQCELPRNICELCGGIILQIGLAAIIP